MRAVLFDFHNTLATCEGWLELEIHTLPALALARLAERGLVAARDAARSEEAVAIFKTIRQQARESGHETSALDGTRQVLARMGVDPPAEELEQTVAELELAYLPRVELTQGAQEAVRTLYETNYRLGVVSSAGYHPFVERALEATGLRPYLTVVMTSVGERLYKSNPEIFRRAARRLGVAPAEAIHVGDHVRYDVQVPKVAGLKAVWFAAHARRSAELYGQVWEDVERQGSVADAIVYEMRDLPGVIDRLAGGDRR